MVHKSWNIIYHCDRVLQSMSTNTVSIFYANIRDDKLKGNRNILLNAYNNQKADLTLLMFP